MRTGTVSASPSSRDELVWKDAAAARKATTLPQSCSQPKAGRGINKFIFWENMRKGHTPSVGQKSLQVATRASTRSAFVASVLNTA